MSGEVKCPTEKVLLIFNNGNQHWCFEEPKECATSDKIVCNEKILDVYKGYCTYPEVITKVEKDHNDVYKHTYTCLKKIEKKAEL